MITLQKVTINTKHEHWERLKKPKGATETEYQFTDGINVIIGHNGTGKSTLLKAIREKLFSGKNVDGLDINHTTDKERKMVYFFLAEENNPSIHLSNISPYDDGFAEKTCYWMERKEMSSGMNTLAFMEMAEDMASNATLVFFDEPEQALDALALLELRRIMKRIAKRTQVVIVTHHPALILMKDVNVIEINPAKSYLSDIKKLVQGI